VWIYVRNIVCSCYAHTYISTLTLTTISLYSVKHSGARQNDLSSYANWKRLWLTFAAFAFEWQLELPPLFSSLSSLHPFFSSFQLGLVNFLEISAEYGLCVCGIYLRMCNLVAAHKSHIFNVLSHLFALFSYSYSDSYSHSYSDSDSERRRRAQWAQSQ